MQFIPKNLNYKQRILNQLEKQNFMHLINFDLDKIDAGITEGKLEIQPIHFQQDGFLHGGVVASLADIVAGFAACSLVAENQNVVTGEIKISYFAKGRGTRLRAIGRVLKAGRRIMFCEAEIFNLGPEEEVLIAKASTSMIVL